MVIQMIRLRDEMIGWKRKKGSWLLNYYTISKSTQERVVDGII